MYVPNFQISWKIFDKNLIGEKKKTKKNDKQQEDDCLLHNTHCHTHVWTTFQKF